MDLPPIGLTHERGHFVPLPLSLSELDIIYGYGYGIMEGYPSLWYGWNRKAYGRNEFDKPISVRSREYRPCSPYLRQVYHIRDYGL